MDFVVLEVYWLKFENKFLDIVIVFMYFIGGGFYLFMVLVLVKKGCYVIYCNSCYCGIDSVLIMEKVVLDLGVCICDVKEKKGYKKVVLVGWSGGGLLLLYYQSQVENFMVMEILVGDFINLVDVNLIFVDGLMLLVVYISCVGIMIEWMDVLILDENDFIKCDLELDLYDFNNLNQVFYLKEFIECYCVVQIV